MRTQKLIKVVVVSAVLLVSSAGFMLTRKSENPILPRTIDPVEIVVRTPDPLSETAGYKNWTKINEQLQTMDYVVGEACRGRIDTRFDTNEKDVAPENPHSDKYINVYVNSTGKDEMLTKVHPKFPIGTVIVKEKLSSFRSTTPELLTVMIKRDKDFNPEVGDWEFLVLNGAATKVTDRGKLENCRSCHLSYNYSDYVTRTYLPDNVRRKLK